MCSSGHVWCTGIKGPQVVVVRSPPTRTAVSSRVLVDTSPIGYPLVTALPSEMGVGLLPDAGRIHSAPNPARAVYLVGGGGGKPGRGISCFNSYFVSTSVLGHGNVKCHHKLTTGHNQRDALTQPAIQPSPHHTGCGARRSAIYTLPRRSLGDPFRPGCRPKNPAERPLPAGRHQRPRAPRGISASHRRPQCRRRMARAPPTSSASLTRKTMLTSRSSLSISSGSLARCE